MTLLQQRLAGLRDEFAHGERTLRELATRRDELTAAMLRISGAIQVLEELLGAADDTVRHDTVRGAEPWLTRR